ncbi:MAG TPA: ImmA/IrrE family metallo-endopeptidase, partial [Solirubrobacteraceae bacterium]
PDRAEIWVNATEAARWPTRRRFTVGHELGHLRLHQHHEATVWCRTGCVEEAAARGAALPVEEAEANQFAAALLMPARLVREHYRRDGDFSALCRRFGASGSAMGKRLHQVV